MARNRKQRKASRPRHSRQQAPLRAEDPVPPPSHAGTVEEAGGRGLSVAGEPSSVGACGATIPLQRALARAGVASRRKAEAIVREGRVTVDGRVAELGQRVDPITQTIAVDGQVLAAPGAHEYIMLHKPRGYLTSRADPRGRPLVFDLVEEIDRPGLVAVGRLDRDTEGLLLLTTDGVLAHRLMHPRFEIPRVYRLQATGPPQAVRCLREGRQLEDGFARPDTVRLLARRGRALEVELVLHEGRKREVRRLARACGLTLQRLQRVALGPLRLGNLPLGHWRRLKPAEVRALRRAVGMSS